MEMYSIQQQIIGDEYEGVHHSEPKNNHKDLNVDNINCDDLRRKIDLAQRVAVVACIIAVVSLTLVGVLAYSYWQNEGNQGPKGDTGPNVESQNDEFASKGHKGEPGPKGLQGDNGLPGQDGLPGPKGVGQKGDKGGLGHPGMQGEPGLKGSNGAKGDEGAAGSNGSEGKGGLKGDVGAQGDTGSPGPKENTGPLGPKGNTGQPGPKGNTGPQGPKGNTGPQGPKGNTGERGPPGDCGPSNYLEWKRNLTDQVLGIRLRDGSASYGRIEIHLGGVWSTVCDDSFEAADARVACRQLGLTGDDYFTIGGGSGNIGLDDVNCTGAETSLVDCGHAGVNTHDCGHGEDVGVVCRIPKQDALAGISTISGELGPLWECGHPNYLGWQTNLSDHVLGIRLRDGSAIHGRVEVYLGEEWYTVCNDHFGTADARVACRQLGLTGDDYFTIGGGSGNIGLDNVNCTGVETALVDCGHAGVNTHNCDHGEDVGVVCKYP